MTFWLKVAIGYVLAAAALLAAFGFEWRTGLDLLVVALGFLPVVVRQSPRLYLLWNRLKYGILNTETSWDLSLQFRGNFDEAKVETFVHRLALQDAGATELLPSSPTRYLLHYRRLFTVELALGPAYESLAQPDEQPSADREALDVTVYEQQVSYRRSRRVLEDVLVPLFEELVTEFSPTSASYSLRVRFDGNNPFFGLYLRLLRPDLVNEFQFEFQLPQARKGEYVRVNKTDMVVTATTVQSLRRAVLAGLTFSAAAA